MSGADRFRTGGQGVPTKIQEIVSTAFHSLAIVFTLAALVPFFILSYWWLDDRRPIENVSVWFIGWDPEDPDVANLRWRADRYRVCDGRSNLWLFADRPHILDPEPLPPPRAHENIKPGAQWTTAVRIPPDKLVSKNGYVYLRIHMTWECNPLHRWYPLELDIPEISIPVGKTLP
jgi:hypothetical protein